MSRKICSENLASKRWWILGVTVQHRVGVLNTSRNTSEVVNFNNTQNIFGCQGPGFKPQRKQVLYTVYGTIYLHIYQSMCPRLTDCPDLSHADLTQTWPLT